MHIPFPPAFAQPAVFVRLHYRISIHHAYQAVFKIFSCVRGLSLLLSSSRIKPLEAKEVILFGVRVNVYPSGIKNFKQGHLRADTFVLQFDPGCAV
jgi:hypothetical protein